MNKAYENLAISAAASVGISVAVRLNDRRYRLVYFNKPNMPPMFVRSAEDVLLISNHEGLAQHN